MLSVVVVVVQVRWSCCDSWNENSKYCKNTAYCDGCTGSGGHNKSCGRQYTASDTKKEDDRGGPPPPVLVQMKGKKSTGLAGVVADVAAVVAEEDSKDDAEDRRSAQQATEGKGDDGDDGTGPGKGGGAALMEDIGVMKEMKMADWAADHYNVDRKGLLKRKTTIEKMLQWKPKLIKMALMSLSDANLSEVAVQAFKNIISYMGDRASKKEEGGHAHKLLDNTLNEPEELRDEVFCQLIKQTSNNPKPGSVRKGWHMISICAGCFPPSKEFEPYLMSYCEKNSKDPDEQIQKFSKYVVTGNGEIGKREKEKRRQRDKRNKRRRAEKRDRRAKGRRRIIYPTHVLFVWHCVWSTGRGAAMQE